MVMEHPAKNARGKYQREHDSDRLARFRLAKRVDIGPKWADDRPIRRVDCHEGEMIPPCLPFTPCGIMLLFGGHMHTKHPSPHERAGIRKGFQARRIQASHGHQTGAALPLTRTLDTWTDVSYGDSGV